MIQSASDQARDVERRERADAMLRYVREEEERWKRIIRMRILKRRANLVKKT